MSNPFSEMMNKTGVTVRGIVNTVNEFTGKPTAEYPTPKTYWSVDLIVKDHKAAVTVKLPEDFDRAKYQPGEVVAMLCRIATFNGKTSFQSI